jgi:hypothetical protein
MLLTFKCEISTTREAGQSDTTTMVEANAVDRDSDRDRERENRYEQSASTDRMEREETPEGNAGA